MRRFVVPSLGSFAFGGGLVSFLGWALDVPRLADWFGNGISIQPNTAVAVAATGAALLLLSFGFRRSVVALGVLVAFLGLSAFLQYLLDFNLESLNTALIFGREWGRGGVVAPGRMGPPGAFCWTLIGIGLILASGSFGRRKRTIVPILAMITLALSMFAITGYLYGAQEFYSAPHLTVIALQTAVFIVIVSAALIAQIIEFGPMRLFTDRGLAGVIARSATPAIILASFGLGMLRLAGERAGLYDLASGTAGRTIVEIILLLGLLAWTLVTIRRHDAALREADRRKDEFLATLAHELRGPLAPMRNMLEVLKRAGDAADVQERARETMQRQLLHLVRLVDDLIDVSRITHGKVELRRERVPIALVIEHAVETYEAVAANAGITLRVLLPTEPVEVLGDAVRLTQVFGNILHNACNFTQPSGTITIRAAVQGPDVEISVQDTGIGIAPEKLHHVFEMFSQVESGEKAQGLGIGLALVKRLVELHGGRVRAHSEGLNRGVEIAVRLPVLKSARRPAELTPTS